MQNSDHFPQLNYTCCTLNLNEKKRISKYIVIVYVYLNTQCNHKNVVKFDGQKVGVVVAVS